MSRRVSPYDDRRLGWEHHEQVDRHGSWTALSARWVESNRLQCFAFPPICRVLFGNEGKESCSARGRQVGEPS